MSKLFNFDGLINKVEAYVESKIKLAAMNAKEELADTITKLFPLLLLGFAGFIIIIFLSLTLGLVLNYFLNSTWLGFAVLTGIYIIFFLAFLWIKDTTWFKKGIKKKIVNTMNQTNE